jgi:hypothetical protein
MARRKPSSAEATDSTTLSVSSCRTMRCGEAPIEIRTATSRSRSAARASSRFATFAQAISSRKPTAPKSVQRTARELPTSRSFSGVTYAVMFEL